MGGEQAAAVLHLLESEKREREGRSWPTEEQEAFKKAIKDRWEGGQGGFSSSTQSSAQW